MTQGTEQTSPEANGTPTPGGVDSTTISTIPANGVSEGVQKDYRHGEAPPDCDDTWRHRCQSNKVGISR